MSNFVYPEWQLPPDYHRPPPPPDPETQVEINTRVDDALNRFMATSHKALYSESDAYFRKRGRDAVDGLPTITGLLAELKKQTLAGVRSDLVRQPLEQRLAGRIELDEHDIDRHFRQQKKEWQRGVLDDRIELIRQRAGLIWNDRPSLQEHLDAAADLARSHAAVDGLAPDSEEAKARVRAASAGVLRAAIEGALDGNDSATALDLYERVKDRIAPGYAEVLARQIEDARRTDTGRAWVEQIAQVLPDRPQEIDVAHRAAVGRIPVDWPDDPEMQAVVRHLLDVAFDDHRHGITQRRTDLEKQIEEWFEQRLPDGRRQNRRPPRALWTQLDPDQRQQVYERLKLNTDAVASPDQHETPEATAADTPGHGIAPDVEPPPGSAEYQAAQTSIPSEAAASPSAAPASSAAVIGTASPIGGQIGQFVGRIASAVAPYVGAAGTVAAATLPLILIPTNTQSGTVELDKGLRARIRPGQRSVALERKADGGFLGTGFGAKWENLPIDAEIAWGPQGRAIRINPEQLKEALGEEQANRVLAAAGATPPSEPQVIPPPLAYEMRIGDFVRGDARPSFREASEERVSQVCQNYPTIYRFALEASQGARVAGIPNGLTYGNRVDREAKAKIREMSQVLEKNGIRILQPEIALRNGEKFTYFPRGSSVLDVLEIYDNETICIYDFKTGGARFPDDVMTRYIKEAALYAEAEKLGYKYIYAIPVRVP